jgi:hypothetical protein
MRKPKDLPRIQIEPETSKRGEKSTYNCTTMFGYNFFAFSMFENYSLRLVAFAFSTSLPLWGMTKEVLLKCWLLSPTSSRYVADSNQDTNFHLKQPVRCLVSWSKLGDPLRQSISIPSAKRAAQWTWRVLSARTGIEGSSCKEKLMNT